MQKTRILFVCTYSGARSLIAAAYCKKLEPEAIEAAYSGFEAGNVDPRIFQLISQDGLSASNSQPKTVFERHKNNEVYDYVITMCYKASTEQCPIFSASINSIYKETSVVLKWSIPDFKSINGSDDAWMDAAGKIKETIKAQVTTLITKIKNETESANRADNLQL